MTFPIFNLPPLPETSAGVPDVIRAPKTRRCEICNKVPEKLGVNSSDICTICESCDRQNNPYYYDDECHRVKTTFHHWREIKSRLVMLMVLADVKENIDPSAKLDRCSIMLTSQFGREELMAIVKTSVDTILGDIKKPMPIIPWIGWDYVAGEECEIDFHNLSQYDLNLDPDYELGF